ncbi:homoserine dehydrogenase [Fictibacillus nanhaiensis]|uniref:homoserine dehydrogenase n=1 Tax=Fictibacillus nanhaiensis TaxID=742169 RepID=UPI001C981086|nr:homoserine dehydrogenase [Fictibacillus nanhaiensis]MBY6037785.1 homoserine dehydrogenase [Fictibacillus nanhaiensis]
MAPIKAALLGFGTVGQGVYESLKTHKEQLKSVLGSDIVIEAVLVKDGTKKRDIDENVRVTTDFEEILRIPDLQVVFEAIVGEEPGFTYLKKAIEKGCHVITANKVMFARHGKTLLNQASEAGVSVGFEATTAGGTPIIRSISQLLQVNNILSIEAILNGTSNYILSNMREKGLAFEDALKTAQKLGYAEADPVNDVEGFDAFYKLIILSELSFGYAPDWERVDRSGITHVAQNHIEVFKEWGYRIKHLAQIHHDSGELLASVKPVLLDAEHSLYGIEGVQNAVMIETSLAGKVTLQGAGAGKLPTASAMVEDLTYVFQSSRNNVFNKSCDVTHREDDEAKQSNKKQYAVIGPKPLTVNYVASNAIQVLRQEEKDGQFYSLITCWKEAADTLLIEANTQIYDVASSKEVHNREKEIKQVINL